MSRFRFSFLTIFISIYSLLAQKISFDPIKDTFEIGEPITIRYELIINNTDSLKTIYPSNIKLNDNLELQEEKIPQEVERIQNSIKFIKEIIVAGYEGATYVIPPFAIGVHGEDTIYTSSAKINIARFELQQGQKFDIKPIERPKMSWKDYIKEILIYTTLFILAIASVLIFNVWKKNRAKQRLTQVFEVKYQVTPFEECLNTLKKLEEDKLWKQNYQKLHYSVLTDALKKYLSVVYKINATESTSSELLEKLKHTPMSERAIEQLKRILDNADLIKFANDTIPDNMHELLLSSTVQFITTDMNH